MLESGSVVKLKDDILLHREAIEYAKKFAVDTIRKAQASSESNKTVTVVRAKLDIALVQRLVEQMRQSTKVIYPALGDLASEIKKHREALVAAAASLDKSARALGRWTVVLAIATVVLAVATLAPLFAAK